MNLKKSLSQLEAYFKEEANTPEIIQHSVKRAACVSHLFAPIRRT